MKKVIEAKGKFFVKEYSENGDSLSISEPFNTEVEALSTISEEEAPTPRRRGGRAAKVEVEETEEEVTDEE